MANSEGAATWQLPGAVAADQMCSQLEAKLLHCLQLRCVCNMSILNVAACSCHIYQKVENVHVELLAAFRSWRM